MSATDARPPVPPAGEPPPPARPNYMAGFDGIASGAFSDEQRKLLAEPVPEDEVEIRYDGIPFLPGVWYRRQLTRALGAGAWAIAPRGPSRTMGTSKTYHGALYVLGRYVSEAVGECEFHAGSKMTEASAFEGAKTDSLSRCCKDLGMATELWDPYWREQFLAKWGRWEMKGDAGKQKKVWSRRDKAGEAELPEHRDAGPREHAKISQQASPPTGPVPEKAGAKPPAKAATPTDETRPTRPATATLPGASSVGDGITSDQVRAAASATGQTGKWCNGMFRGYFGVERSLDEMSQEQRQDALRLLRAAKDGKATFDAMVAGLVEAKRITACAAVTL